MKFFSLLLLLSFAIACPDYQDINLDAGVTSTSWAVLNATDTENGEVLIVPPAGAPTVAPLGAVITTESGEATATNLPVGTTCVTYTYTDYYNTWTCSFNIIVAAGAASGSGSSGSASGPASSGYGESSSPAGSDQSSGASSASASGPMSSSSSDIYASSSSSAASDQGSSSSASASGPTSSSSSDTYGSSSSSAASDQGSSSSASASGPTSSSSDMYGSSSSSPASDQGSSSSASASGPTSSSSSDMYGSSSSSPASDQGSSSSASASGPTSSSSSTYGSSSSAASDQGSSSSASASGPSQSSSAYGSSSSAASDQGSSSSASASGPSQSSSVYGSSSSSAASDQGSGSSSASASGPAQSSSSECVESSSSSPASSQAQSVSSSSPASASGPASSSSAYGSPSSSSSASAASGVNSGTGGVSPPSSPIIPSGGGSQCSFYPPTQVQAPAIIQMYPPYNNSLFCQWSVCGAASLHIANYSMVAGVLTIYDSSCLCTAILWSTLYSSSAQGLASGQNVDLCSESGCFFITYMVSAGVPSWFELEVGCPESSNASCGMPEIPQGYAAGTCTQNGKVGDVCTLGCPSNQQMSGGPITMRCGGCGSWIQQGYGYCLVQSVIELTNCTLGQGSSSGSNSSGSSSGSAVGPASSSSSSSATYSSSSAMSSSSASSEGGIGSSSSAVALSSSSTTSINATGPAGFLITATYEITVPNSTLGGWEVFFSTCVFNASSFDTSMTLEECGYPQSRAVGTPDYECPYGSNLAELEVYLVAGTYYLQINYTESFNVEIVMMPCVCNGTNPATACNVSCTCETGYGYPGCSLCVENFFSTGSPNGSNPSPCVDCASLNNTQFQGLMGATGCACVGGHTWINHQCSPCPANHFSEGGSNATCIDCSSVNNTDTSGLTGQAACLCAKGFGWDYVSSSCVFGMANSQTPGNSGAMGSAAPIFWAVIVLAISAYLL